MKGTHIIIFLLGVIPVRCIGICQLHDDVSIIRKRVLDLILLPSEENIPAIVQQALNFSETLNSSCYWPDVIYNDTRLAYWRTLNHLGKISTMLQALTTKDSSVYNNPQLRTAVHCALGTWLVNDWQSPNWYHNEIAVPIELTGHLLMLGDDVTSAEREKIIQISFRAAWWLNRTTDVGTNLVWKIQAQLYRSLATNNITGLQQGFTRMWQDNVVQPKDGDVGIKPDWAYHFHGSQILSGSYGMAWAQNIFAFTVCTRGTKYAPTEQQLAIFVQMITKGDAWMIVGKYFDWHVIGRAVSRPNKEYFVQFYPEFIRQMADLIDSNNTKLELINLADRLEDDANATALIGNRHFFVSDYQVHRRSNWVAAIKMQSIRTQPIECINKENQKAEHSGQGVLNLHTGKTYDYEDIFPLLDWQAINGISVEHDIPLQLCNGRAFSWKKLAFVGGVSDTQYGLAIMDTASHNLTAQRSWHFYDDVIIALATNLMLKASTTAWTTLASRLLPAGEITIGFFNSTTITLSDGHYSFPYVQGQTSNVQWIHVGQSNIGYLLQSQNQYASLGIELATKTANYLDIGPFDSTVTVRILTIWLNHGRGPYTLDYNYMILPYVSRESIPALIEQYDREQVFSCISTNSRFHGTIWPALNRASFVLWKDASTTFSCQSSLFTVNIQLNQAGTYLFSETATHFTVTASHPIRIGGFLKVTVDRVGSGEGCTSSQSTNAGSTDVTLTLPSSSEFLGASVGVQCKK